MSTFKKRKSTDEEVFCLPVRVKCLQLCETERKQIFVLAVASEVFYLIFSY